MKLSFPIVSRNQMDNLLAAIDLLDDIMSLTLELPLVYTAGRKDLPEDSLNEFRTRLKQEGYSRPDSTELGHLACLAALRLRSHLKIVCDLLTVETPPGECLPSPSGSGGRSVVISDGCIIV